MSARPELHVSRGSLEIRVLGPLEVSIDGAPLVVDTRKALAILALLAVQRRPFARDELAALLWPESDDESARGALRRTLSVLRTALGDRWLTIDRATVALDDGVGVDLAVVEAALPSRDRRVLSAAAALARGPFLAGFSLRDSGEFDEWRATRATSVERSVASVLDRLADTAEAARDWTGAAAAANQRLGLDPLDEGAHRRLMAILARGGDRAGAIRQYRACVAMLEHELGVAPLAETTALYEEIRDGRLAVEPDHVEQRAAPLSSTDVAFRLPIVGRDEALGRVRSALAADGRRLVAITGEAGIGKSRLVEAVAAEASSAGRTVIAARAYAAETGIAYGTIVGLLRAGLAGGGAVDRLRTLPEPVLAELARLVDLPSGLVTVRSPDDRAPDPASHARLLTAIASGLGALAGAGPLPGLLVVEDVHWADGATRDALGWLARRLGPAGPGLLLTWRPEDLDEPALAFVRALDADRLVEVPLGPLQRADIARLVDAAAAAGLRVPGVDELVQASEGLPLFVAEALLGGTGPDGEPDAARRTVRALLRDRLQAVGETAAQVLAATAVVGRSFDLATVRGVSGRSEDETVAALEELVRRGLLRELPPAAGVSGWDVSHARLREAAYEATSLGRRQILHRRAADILRDEPGARSDPGRLALLASHELSAGRGGEAAIAFADAGLASRALSASREAAAHLEQAIALGHPDTARLQVALGEVRTALGDYREAIAALEAAAGLLPAEELSAVELRLGRAHLRRGDLASAASHLDAALEALAGDPDGATRARVLVERAAVALRSGDTARAIGMAVDAHRLGDAVGDRAVVAAAERVEGLAARDRGDLPAARSALERSVALAGDDADAGSAIAARNALALVLAASGEHDAAVGMLDQALAASVRTGERHLEAAIENNLADVLHAAGRGDEAMGHLKRAVAIFAEVGGRSGELEPEIWMLATW